MGSVACECTNKTIHNLENAIEYLLLKGRQVNKILDEEKAINENRKSEQVEEIKGQAKSRNSEIRNKNNVMTKKKSEVNNKLAMSKPVAILYEPKEDKDIQINKRIHNKRTGGSEMVDFDIPSLPTEESSKRSNSATNRRSFSKLSMNDHNKKPKRTTTVETTTLTETFTLSGRPNYDTSIRINDTYLLDRGDERTESLPSLAKIKQLPDGSLDLTYLFYDETGKEVFNIKMILHGDKAKNVMFNGKLLQLA